MKILPRSGDLHIWIFLPLPIFGNGFIMVLRIKICLLICLGAVANNHAQHVPPVPIYGKGINHPFSWVVNPAELGNESGLSAAIFTQHNIQIPEIRQYFLSGRTPLSSGGIGLEAGSYGNETYHEWMAGIGYGLNIGNASIGIKMNYTGITIPGFQSQQTYLLKFGSLIALSRTLKAAAVMGVQKTSLYSTDLQNAPFFEYEFGLGYQPSSKFLLSMQAGTIDTRFYSKVMLNYYFHPSFSALLAFETNAAILAVNAGWHLKQFSIHISCRVEPHTGFSPGIIFCYQPELLAGEK